MYVYLKFKTMKTKHSSRYSSPDLIADIAKLNDIVLRKTTKFVSDSKLSGEPLPPEVESVLKSGDYNVYKNRTNWLPVFFGIGSAIAVSSNTLSRTSYSTGRQL